jgi:hypothetical protein
MSVEGATGRPHWKVNGNGVTAGTQERPPLSDEQSVVLIDAVDRASRVGLVMRTALFSVSVLAAILATLYTARHGNEMVGSILDRDSVIFSAGGVGSYLLGVLFRVPSTVRCNLSALSQRHLIVSGYAREIGLIETEAYRSIAQARKQQPGADLTEEVAAAALRIRAATGTAVARIKKHCKYVPE